MKILKLTSLLEKKMWYKDNKEIVKWLESKHDKIWIWLDTETTGLGGPKKQQLTQISAVATTIHGEKEIDIFDEKIKLTKDTKSKFSDSRDITKKILKFNHYGSGDYKYKDEQLVINEFFKWLESFNSDLFLIAQNASFDMNMLSGRGEHNIEHEVFDTKDLIQLYYIPTLQKRSETEVEYKNIINTIGTSERDNGLISSSLSKIGPSLNISMDNYHDALTDCRITIKMYNKILDFLKDNYTIDISKYQIERIKTKL